MRAAGLRAKAVQGYRAKVNVHHLYARHPNRLWTTRVTGPNQVWVGDITYLAVSCAVLVQAARHSAARGVIFHSDRGSEYMGAQFCAQVAQLGFLQSASVRGPGDNAHAESFFHSLKVELTRGVTFPTDRALDRALCTYIRYYNETRLHSSLDYLSPLAFEQRAA